MSCMDKRTQIAIIGDRDSVLLAKAVGLGVYDESDPERAEKLIYRLAREGCKVIFLTEPLYENCGEAITKFKSEPYPAIIPVPDSRGHKGSCHGTDKGQCGKGHWRGHTFCGGQINGKYRNHS